MSCAPAVERAPIWIAALAKSHGSQGDNAVEVAGAPNLGVGHRCDPHRPDRRTQRTTARQAVAARPDSDYGSTQPLGAVAKVRYGSLTSSPFRRC